MQAGFTQPVFFCQLAEALRAETDSVLEYEGFSLIERVFSRRTVVGSD